MCGCNFQFRRIDIHYGFVRLARQLVGRVTGNGEIQAHAKRKQKVAVLKGEVRAPRGHRSGAAHIQRLIARDQIGGAPGRRNRNIQQFSQLVELFLRARQPNAVAGEKQGPLGLIQLDNGLPHLGL